MQYCQGKNICCMCYFVIMNCSFEMAGNRVAYLNPMAFRGLIGYDSTYMLIQLFRMLYIVKRCTNHMVRQAFSNRNYYNNIISPPGPFQCPVCCIRAQLLRTHDLKNRGWDWLPIITQIDRQWRGAVWGSQPPNYLNQIKAQGLDQLLWMCNQ